MTKDGYASRFVSETIGIPLGNSEYLRLNGKEVDTVCAHLSGKATNPDPFQPVIEDVIDSVLKGLIDESASKEYPLFFKERWPEGKEFAIALTHDSDRIQAPISHLRSVRERFTDEDYALAIENRKNLYLNIDDMAAMERKYGFRSSFYFLLDEYDITSLTEKLSRLRSDGWEMGLHGGLRTSEDLSKMRHEIGLFVSAFGTNPQGIREHYLKFDPKVTWRIMEELGLSYDTTWGFNDRPGFKAGLSLPFHPPDSDWEMMNILEIPLILMDTSLWGYMHLTEEEGLRMIEKVIAIASSRGGLFTLLWHQEALLMRGGRIYPEILKRIPSSCFVGSASMIDEWWRGRSASKMTISHTNRSWSCRVTNAVAGLRLTVLHRNLKMKTEGKCRPVVSNGNISKVDVQGDCVIRLEA